MPFHVSEDVKIFNTLAKEKAAVILLIKTINWSSL